LVKIIFDSRWLRPGCFRAARLVKHRQSLSICLAPEERRYIEMGWSGPAGAESWKITGLPKSLICKSYAVYPANFCPLLCGEFAEFSGDLGEAI
jgi:hypothetical protein